MENSEFLRSLLKELSKTIPHQWRVQSYSKKKPVATVMAYIDARDCMDVLNAHAVYGWTRRHYEVAGKVYCSVGIYMPDGSIQERSDCGVESNQDAEKGQSSDSFKRACVNWGIGGFLYDTKVQYIATNEVKSNSNYPYCIDENGKQIWDVTDFVNKKNCKVDDRAKQEAVPEVKKLPELKEATEQYLKVESYLKTDGTVDDIKKKYTVTPMMKAKLDLIIIERNKA